MENYLVRIQVVEKDNTKYMRIINGDKIAQMKIWDLESEFSPGEFMFQLAYFIAVHFLKNKEKFDKKEVRISNKIYKCFKKADVDDNDIFAIGSEIFDTLKARISFN